MLYDILNPIISIFRSVNIANLCKLHLSNKKKLFAFWSPWWHEQMMAAAMEFDRAQSLSLSDQSSAIDAYKDICEWGCSFILCL